MIRKVGLPLMKSTQRVSDLAGGGSVVCDGVIGSQEREGVRLPHHMTAGKTAPISNTMKRYTTIIHQNSRNSQRRGLCGLMLNRKTGQPEYRDSFTKQVFADPEGEELPVMHSASVIRSFRSKHVPHVGKKHAAKLEKRTNVS